MTRTDILRTDGLRAHGIGAPWTFGLVDRVRFAELDALGHVGHTAYLRWFESYRIAHLRDRGVTDYGPDAPRMVLRRIEADYRAEMWLDDAYVVTGRVARLRESSFTMTYAVHALRDGGTVLTAEGFAVQVLLTPDGTGRMPMTDAARARVVALDGAEMA
ncbi:MAG: acyl-CoA thioesterase [Paracoccaceae bacterium]